MESDPFFSLPRILNETKRVFSCIFFLFWPRAIALLSAGGISRRRPGGGASVSKKIEKPLLFRVQSHVCILLPFFGNLFPAHPSAGKFWLKAYFIHDPENPPDPR
jgi:hypothetical protein